MQNKNIFHSRSFSFISKEGAIVNAVKNISNLTWMLFNEFPCLRNKKRYLDNFCLHIRCKIGLLLLVQFMHESLFIGSGWSLL